MTMNDVPAKIAALKSNDKLLPEALENIKTWSQQMWLPAWAMQTLAQLIDEEKWDELNNRFYKQNEFGTAGIRGRTISQYTPAAEAGTKDKLGAPQYAALGSATMNDFNVLRATIGLYRYCEKVQKQEGQNFSPLKLVISHDVRHFSRHFAELTASAWNKLGGTAFLFDGPRSTPQLSFTVRYTNADAGVMVTASHNPAHDNGYKVYWKGGAAIVLEHDAGIISQVNATPLSDVEPFLQKDLSRVVVLPSQADNAYLAALKSTLIEPEVLKNYPPKMVYSPIHGTGYAMVPRAMKTYGAGVELVEAQTIYDGRFPTVQSPNPQNAEALTLAMKKAEEMGVDVALGTDPDCDRMGAVVRKKDGTWLVLTGNTIGSLLAEDRLNCLKTKGILPATGHPNATLIKTFVTTPLQDAIANAHGVQCVNTLTGFKWICNRLAMYEQNAKAAIGKKGLAIDYDNCSDDARRQLLLDHSKWYVFGGEESYGYLGSDRVRDKDGNAAVLMFAEMLARLAAKGETVFDALDKLYLKYGFYAEALVNISFEGAAGAIKLKKLIASYAQNPPKKLGDFVVKSTQDFTRETITDVDGQTVPKTSMIFCELDDGTSFAIRPSGTEPNVRYYCFTREAVREAADLPGAQTRAAKKLDELKAALKADAAKRTENA